MLTENRVLKFYQDGIRLRFSRKRVKSFFKGEYDPSEFMITIYTSNTNSRFDRDITILHEYIHARDDVRSLQYRDSQKEESSVEREALETYHKKPNVLELIKTLHRIRKY